MKSDSPTNNLNPPQDGRVWTRAVLFFALLAAGLAADLLTKHYTFQHFFDPELERNQFAQIRHYWVPGILGIQTSTNGGALFGMGQGGSVWFAALSLIFFGGILTWLFAWGGTRDRWLTGALGLISGGILGNFYDRVGWGFTPGHPEAIRYHVRDWILFRLEGVPNFDPWPNFNLADCWLVIGAGLLLIHALWLSNPSVSASSSE
ncbi:MAG: signal peptidase II [Planctomycetota bacterium]